MLNCLFISKNGNIASDQYFLGTMLFVGDCFSDDKAEVDVVDGQQRLTTITILFSVLSDKFLQLGQDVLSKQIFKYIMTYDDNCAEVRILRSKTHYPFFAFYIQERKKENIQEPESEEEQCIKEAYEYLYEALEENKLREFLRKKHSSDFINQLEYIDILKVIRDQVLNTTFVSISTKENQAPPCTTSPTLIATSIASDT